MRYNFAMSENASSQPRRGAPLHGEERKVRKTVTVDPKVWDAAAETANRRDESMSGVVEASLRRYVRRNAPGDSTE